MSDRVRVGVIGLGFMGVTHVRIYEEHCGAEVVAVADVDPVKRSGDVSGVGGNVGDGGDGRLDLSGVRVYAEALDLINDPDVDLVDVCLPTPLHRDIALAALAAGKHLRLEKPIARTSAEAREIVDAAKVASGCFLVGMCVRYWPEYRVARECYASGALGRVRSANFRRLSPSISNGGAWQNWFMTGAQSGGALLDLHLHDADQIRYFFGRPKAVQAFGVAGMRSDAVDHVMCRYDFGDGALIIAEGGWAACRTVPFEMSFQIVCDQGTLRLSGEGLRLHREDGSVEDPMKGVDHPATGWHAQVDYLLGCIADGRPATDFAELDEYLDAMRIIEAEQRSVDSGSPETINYQGVQA